MAENDRRFSCLAYECFVLLDTVCDSYEREAGDLASISRFMREVPRFDQPIDTVALYFATKKHAYSGRHL